MSDALWNGREYEKRMAEADQFMQRWEIMSSYLEQRVAHNYKTNNIVNFVVREIINSQGCMAILELLMSFTSQRNRFPSIPVRSLTPNILFTSFIKSNSFIC